MSQEIIQTKRIGISKARERMNRFYLNEFKPFIS
ncbi:hypothetical protein KC678_01225 [Candidatus Dojkabacteria bacterium]|uniref:Uncharacterized protein n=1 Tax=Candidatus Dojkabacteria bacterium TaxID=2099670 RepID=A0A955IA67_9BACT|nr:hypothetical protein [Candidatus Dojkabacteria bacterium]